MYFKSFVAAVIITGITSVTSFSFNYSSPINGTDSYNATVNNNSTNYFNDTSVNATEASSYPFFYLAGDSYNWFCNVVAGLNYFSPILTILAMKGSSHFIKKWDDQRNKEVEKTLEYLAEAENEITEFLSTVINDFDNGINGGPDKALALGLIAHLNGKNKCETCINEFVDIVGSNIVGSKSKKKELRKENKSAFYDFATQRVVNPRCNHNKELVTISCQKKTTVDKVKSAVCQNWQHPFHWGNLSYSALMLGLPVWLANYLTSSSQAGSTFGDWANFSNVFVIPLTQAWALAQNYLNYDREKARELLEETDRRLESINGMIEIAARVIGRMENQIDKAEARGFIKALILIGWPQDLVEKFKFLAAKVVLDQDVKYFERMRKKLAKAIKDKYQDRKITYSDNEIDNVFNFAKDSKDKNDDDGNDIDVISMSIMDIKE